MDPLLYKNPYILSNRISRIIKGTLKSREFSENNISNSKNDIFEHLAKSN